MKLTGVILYIAVLVWGYQVCLIPPGLGVRFPHPSFMFSWYFGVITWSFPQGILLSALDPKTYIVGWSPSCVNECECALALCKTSYVSHWTFITDITVLSSLSQKLKLKSKPLSSTLESNLSRTLVSKWPYDVHCIDASITSESWVNY